MTVFANAYVYRNATITLAGTDYGNQITKARLVPETPIQTLRTLVPDGVIQDVDSTVWTWEITGVQTKILAGSLWKALNDNNGLQVAVVMIPAIGSGNAQATFTVISVAPDFGGEQGAFNTYDLSLPVLGSPVFGASA